MTPARSSYPGSEVPPREATHKDLEHRTVRRVRCSTRSVPLLAALLLLAGMQASAAAKTTVVVLAFGGNADQPRDRIVAALQSRFRVLPGQELLDACDRLGIQMSRGANLARCAAQIGAVAVIGGSEAGGSLSLAVYSGKTGQPLATGSARASDTRAALVIILRGLKAAPKHVGSAAPAPAPEPAPEPVPEVAPEPAPKKGGGTMPFEPDTVEKGSGGQRIDDSDENPLGRKEQGAAGAAGAKEAGPAAGGPVEKKPAEVELDPMYPRFEGLFGFGVWMRDFSVNDPYPSDTAYNATTNPNGSLLKPPSPGYSSGAAFAFKFSLKARPLSFFTQSFASWFYARLTYGQTGGLSSNNKEKDATTGGTVVKTYATTLRELVFDAGVDWKILKVDWSPRLEAGIGGGLTTFSIDWTDSTVDPHPLPDTSYSFFIFNLRAIWPFLPHLRPGLGLEGFFGIDLRGVGGSGDVEDETTWYGSSTTGGFGLNLGLEVNFKGFLGRIEYDYTRYFLSFNDADARAAQYDQEAASGSATTRAAGGALDVTHGLMFSFGYSL
jgi:hypothetical protein